MRALFVERAVVVFCPYAMVRSMRKLCTFVALPFLLIACESSDGGGKATPDPEPEAVDFGHCSYVNKFSKGEECRQYQGKAWTEELVEEDCAGQSGALAAGACAFEEILGTCLLGEREDQQTLVFAEGSDPGGCGGQKMGCETFGGGVFTTSEVCKGDPVDPPDATVFQPPDLVCKDPVSGEEPGMSEGGQVCTWGMISGCTEPGRKFVDYASCEPVYTQRPYYAVPPPQGAAEPDPRMADPEYKAEVDWVKEQVEACACVCCHQESITPNGAGIWDIEGEGNWINTFTGYGLAFAGGVVPSWPLGAYPKEENNGFDRETTGIPTTDPARMRAFFEGEMVHRGLDVAEYEKYSPTPEFFYEQHTFEPEKCEAGVGVAEDGTMTWSGGSARYVYVLAEGANNPGVPPNLDLPEGTIWRVDVRPDQKAVKSGEVAFGKVPAGAKQGFPADGATPALVAGQTYHLYVLADMGIPITRCLFTVGG